MAVDRPRGQFLGDQLHFFYHPALSYRSSSSTTAPAPRERHKPERIGHYELFAQAPGQPDKGRMPL